MSGYKTPFQRYFVVVGVFCVLLVAVFVSWIRDYVAFEQVESIAMQRFKSFKAYEKDVYFPIVKVAGPEGDLVTIVNRGQFTVLNIWATWCAPCVSELPSLRRLNSVLKRYNEGWRVVAVSVDKKEDIEKVALFTKELNVQEIASYHDYNAELQKAVNVKKLPMTLIIDDRGRILYEIYGDAVWFDSDLISFFRSFKNFK